MTNQEQKYLKEKISKFGTIAIGLSIGLAACGGGSILLYNMTHDNANVPVPQQTQIEEQSTSLSNTYILSTEKGYMNFEVTKITNDMIGEGEYEITYHTIDNYKISFRPDVCIVENPNHEIVASYTDASMEQIDFESKITPYNSNENAETPLSYEINEVENSVDLEN